MPSVQAPVTDAHLLREEIDLGETQRRAARDAEKALQVAYPWYPPELDLPVKPQHVADSLGIQVRVSALPPDVSGALAKKDGHDPVIVLQLTDHPNRQRFTCAHEIGHYWERDDDEYEFVDFRDNLAGRGVDVHEIYANSFAAALLMPEWAVRQLFDHTKDVTELAARFGVSKGAMSIRLQNLGLV